MQQRHLYTTVPAILNIMACRGVMALVLFTILFFFLFPSRGASGGMSAKRTMRPKVVRHEHIYQKNLLVYEHKL